MTALELRIDGEPVGRGCLEEQGRLLLALDDLSATLGGEVKTPDGSQHLTFCQGDLCIPLDVAGAEDTQLVNGIRYVCLDAVLDALNLNVERDGDGRSVNVLSEQPKNGLSVGDRPPGFTLPDLFTGASVSSADFLGRKVVFYMWASW